MNSLYGIPVTVSDLVPRDRAFLVDQTLFRAETRMGMAISNRHSHALLLNVDTWSNIKPVPLWTRHMLGVQEARRDRRKYRRR